MTTRSRFSPFHRVLALLLAVLMLSLSACEVSSTKKPSASKGKNSGASASEKTPLSEQVTLAGVKPAKNDTLLLAYGDDPDTLNVIIANDTTSEAFHRRVYDYLAIPKFENPDEWEPHLAESWTFDEENLEFTIKLRKGVKWHPMKLPNGKPLPEKEFTSRDVKFTFDCILNPNIEAAAIRSYFEDPDAKDESERYKIKVTAPEKYVVKVKWTKPYFLAESATLNSRQIIPQHVYSVDENGDPISFDFSSKEFADGFNNHWANTLMCGTGPMKFQEWERNTRLAVVRNPDYWGKPYYFDRIVAEAVSNPNTMAEMVLKGDLDFGSITEKNKYLQSKDHRNVVSGKVSLFEFTYPSYRYIGWNLRRDFLAEKQVRHALAHAIPVDQIIEQVFKGLAVPVAGPFLPDSRAFDKSIEPITYDLARAEELLTEAGWEDTDENGIRNKKVNGVDVQAKFDLIIFQDSPAFSTVAEIFKENCRKIGVEVNVSPTAWALMLQKLRKKEYDAAMLGWALDWESDPFQLFHGSQADLPESSNSGGYQNEELDGLIEELRITMDKEKQNELYHKIHRIIYDDQPYAFLFSEKSTGGNHGRMKNLNFYAIRPCIDPREWHATKPRQMGK